MKCFSPGGEVLARAESSGVPGMRRKEVKIAFSYLPTRRDPASFLSFVRFALRR